MPSLKVWIRENRAELDKAILYKRDGTYPVNGSRSGLNDGERRLWVLNDESLYLWARGEGVNV